MRRSCWASRASAPASWRMPRRSTRSICAAIRTARPPNAWPFACASCAPPKPRHVPVATQGARHRDGKYRVGWRSWRAMTAHATRYFPSLCLAPCVATQGWEVSGGVAQLARYDGSRLSNGAPPPNSQPVPAAPTVTNNALFNDVDLLARRRGETLDWIGRLAAGYDKSFSKDQFALGNPTRVSLASIEVVDRSLGLLGRLGRQVSNANGLLGRFDGLFLSCQFKPSWAINAAAGYPVEQLIVAPQTQERFETLALAYTPPSAHW